MSIREYANGSDYTRAEREGDPDRLMESVCSRYRDVIVIGIDHDGDEHFHDTFDDMADVMLLLERAKACIMSELEEDG
jgi:hypothetical protein